MTELTSPYRGDCPLGQLSTGMTKRAILALLSHSVKDIA